jgi:hypothetical protein
VQLAVIQLIQKIWRSPDITDISLTSSALLCTGKHTGGAPQAADAQDRCWDIQGM